MGTILQSIIASHDRYNCCDGKVALKLYELYGAWICYASKKEAVLQIYGVFSEIYEISLWELRFSIRHKAIEEGVNWISSWCNFISLLLYCIIFKRSIQSLYFDSCFLHQTSIDYCEGFRMNSMQRISHINSSLNLIIATVRSETVLSAYRNVQRYWRNISKSWLYLSDELLLDPVATRILQPVL